MAQVLGTISPQSRMIMVRTPVATATGMPNCRAMVVVRAEVDRFTMLLPISTALSILL